MISKKVFVLMIMTPFLTEMVSANSSIIVLLNPVFLLLQIISYGIPVVLIREAVIKWNLGLRGLFLLGLAYGFLNEGVFARTFAFTETLLGTTSPSQFILSINPFWVVYISIWHALYAVIFPILIIQYLHQDKESWLSRAQTKWFIAIMVIESLVSLTVGKAPETVFSLIAIPIIVLLAKSQKSKLFSPTSPMVSSRSFWIGMSFILYTILSIMLAKVLSIIPFVLFEIFGLLFFYYILKRKNGLSSTSLLLFGLGAYITLGMFGAIITFNIIILIPNLIVSIILCIFARKILKKSKEVAEVPQGSFVDL